MGDSCMVGRGGIDVGLDVAGTVVLDGLQLGVGLDGMTVAVARSGSVAVAIGLSVGHGVGLGATVGVARSQAMIMSTSSKINAS